MVARLWFSAWLPCILLGEVPSIQSTYLKVLTHSFQLFLMDTSLLKEEGPSASAPRYGVCDTGLAEYYAANISDESWLNVNYPHEDFPCPPNSPVKGDIGKFNGIPSAECARARMAFGTLEGDDVVFKPSFAWVAKQPKKRLFTEPVLVPRVAHDFIVTKRNVRQAVRASCVGNMCNYCGVVMPSRWGHLPLCMAPIDDVPHLISRYEEEERDHVVLSTQFLSKDDKFPPLRGTGEVPLVGPIDLPNVQLQGLTDFGLNEVTRKFIDNSLQRIEKIASVPTLRVDTETDSVVRYAADKLSNIVVTPALPHSVKEEVLSILQELRSFQPLQVPQSSKEFIESTVDKIDKVVTRVTETLSGGVDVNLKLPTLYDVLPFGHDLERLVNLIKSTVSDVFSTGRASIECGAGWWFAFAALPLAAAWLFGQLTGKVLGTVQTALKAVWTMVLGVTEDWFPDTNGVHLQSGLSDVISKVFAALMTPIFGDLLLPKQLLDFVRGLASSYKSYNSWTAFSEWFVDHFMILLSKAGKLVGVKIQCKLDEVAEVSSYIDAAEALCASIATGKAPLRPSTATEYKRLEMMGLHLLKKYRDTAVVCNAVKRCQANIRQMSTYIAGLLSNSAGMRAPPAALLLAGKPGIGKTLMMQTLSQDVLERIMTSEEIVSHGLDVMSEVYSHNGGDYWDGYYGQKLMFCDDIFQKRVITGAPTDDFNDKIIKLIGPAPCPLNMPDLASKGRFNFVSPAMIMTTNSFNLAPELAKVVMDEDAVVRRFWSLKLTLKPDWTLDDGHLDYDKFRAYIDRKDTEYCTPEAWIIEPWDMLHGRPDKNRTINGKKEDITMADVITDYVRHINLLQDGHASVVKSIRSRMVHRMSDTLVQVATKLGKEEVLDQIKEMQIELQSDTSLCDMLSEDFPFLSFNETDPGPEVNSFPLNDTLIDSTGPGMITCSFMDIRSRIAKWFQPMIERFNSIRSNPFVGECLTVCFKLLAVKALVMGATYLFRVLFPGTDKEAPLKCAVGPTIFRKNLDWFANRFIPEDFDIPETDNGDGKPIRRAGDHVLRNALMRQGGAAVKLNSGIQDAEPELWAVPSVSPVAGKNCEDIVKMFLENSYQLVVQVCEGVEKRAGTVTFIKNKFAIMNKHFFVHLRKFPSTTSIRLVSSVNPSYVINSTVGALLASKVVDSPHHDLAGVIINNARLHSSIVEKFCSATQHSAIGSTRALLVTPKFGDGPERRVFTLATHCGQQYQNTDIGTYQSIFWYAAPTVVGDCGSALFALDNGHLGCQRILGIHMATCDDVGPSSSFATCVPRELLEQWTSTLFAPIMPEIKFHTLDVRPTTELPIQGSFLPCAKLLGAEHRGAIKTAKKKVLGMVEFIQPVFPLTRKPARLSPFVDPLTDILVKPMEKALSKVAEPVFMGDTPTLVRAVSQVAAHVKLCTTTAGVEKPRVWTKMEALTGQVDGQFKLEPIDRSSGPGYPYCLSGFGRSPMSSKRPLTDCGDGSYFIRQDLSDLVDEIVEDAKRGVRREHVYVDFLKDELRPIEKVKEGKTRLISSCPLPLTLATRMFFGDFASAIMTCKSPPTNLGICVGINPFSDWDQLVKPVFFVGRGRVIAGDFSGFDATETSGVHDHILALINDWYNDCEENQLARKVLWLEVTNSLHLNYSSDQRKNLLYWWVKSLPSGHPLTSIINSLYNMITFVYCFNKRVPDGNFFSDTCIRFYGDDNWGAISPKVVDKFNQCTIQQDAKDLGLVYTDDTKVGEISPTKSIYESTFLKRTPWYDEDDGRWYGALDIHSTIEQVCWVKGDITQESVGRNVERAMSELSIHPLKTWNYYAPLVDRAFGCCYPLATRPGSSLEARRYWRGQGLGLYKSEA